MSGKGTDAGNWGWGWMYSSSHISFQSVSTLHLKDKIAYFILCKLLLLSERPFSLE